MAKRARDFQRSKVYAWERDRFPIHEEAFPLAYCRDLAAELYGARVKVKDGRGRRSAVAYWDRYPTIALPKWARNRYVIAHEVAHLVHRSDTSIPAHGALFMRTYIDLLEHQAIGCAFDLIAEAKEFGLKVA